jgi:tetratricopeptide (TPR) repeat protein
MIQPKLAGRPRVRARWVFVLAVGVSVWAVGCSDPAAKKQRFFESGNRFFKEANYPSAIIEFRNAIQIDPRFGDARKQLAESYLHVGDGRAALEEYVRAADLLPDDAVVQLKAGNLLLAARKPEDAMARADAVLRAHPDNVDALVLRGSALAGLSSYDDALTAIEQAIKIDPDRGATYTNLGLVELARGRRDEAESALSKAVDLSPKEPRARLALGNFYWAAGRTGEAEKAFDAALELEPSNVQANRFMASLKFSTGRRAEAEPYLRRIADSSGAPEASLVLVDYYLVTARPKDAIARIEGLKAGRNLPEVVLRLARAHAASGDLAKSRSIVEDILKANDKDAAAQLLKGQLLLLEGKRDEAFAAIRAAVAIDPSSADAQFALGKMYAARGDGSAAQQAFREVLRINPRASGAQVELSVLQARTKPEDSIRHAEEAARNDPQNLTARVALVRSLIAARDVARAEREMSKLRAEYPNVGAVHAQDGRLALLKNDLPAARRAIESAGKLDPRSLETLAVSIALDLKQKNTAGARARLEERLKTDQSPEVLLLAANTYVALKDQAAAEKVLRAAVAADPSRNEPYAMLGSLYLSQKKLDEAFEEFESLSTRQARPVESLTMMGMILEQQGKPDLARKRYEEAIALDSSAGTAANNLAWLIAESGENLDEALRLAQSAVTAAPDTPQILDTLGWVYYKKGLSQLAVAQFEKAIERQSNNGFYHYHLGLALIQAGDKSRGREALERALKVGTNATTSAEIRRSLGETPASR